MSDIVSHCPTKIMSDKNNKVEKISIRLETNVLLVLQKLAQAEDKNISHFIRSELKKIAAKADKK